MPKLEYIGIIARPGTYKRKNGVITKTWEELRRAFQRTPGLPLTLGHPRHPDGRPRLPSADDYIGWVSAVINEEDQVIEGIFKPYEEDWDKIPPPIQEKMENDLPVKISAGFEPGKVVNGAYVGMLHNHVAVLADGETPVCPLGECGINVRLEAHEEDIFMTYEQATSTKDDEPQKEEAPAAAPQKEQGGIFFTDEQFAKLLETLKPQPQPTVEAGADAAAEEAIEEQPPQETASVPAQEPAGVPEGAFAAGNPTKAPDPRLKAVQPDGSVVVQDAKLFLGSGTKEK